MLSEPQRRPSLTAEQRKLAKLKKERAKQQALFIKQAEDAKKRMERDAQKESAESAMKIDGNGPVGLPQVS